MPRSPQPSTPIRTDVGARRVAAALVSVFGPVRMSGRERIPAEGPLIVAVNHRSWLDGPLVFGALGRPVSFLVKSEAFGPGVGPVLRRVGQVPVVRQRVDRAALRDGLQVLAEGEVLGIFPEGARGDGRVAVVRPGVAWFALRSGATVLPIVCQQTREAVRTVRRVAMSVTVGKPLTFEQWPADRPLNRRLVRVTAERIRVALADLVDSGDRASRHAPGAVLG